VTRPQKTSWFSRVMPTGSRGACRGFGGAQLRKTCILAEEPRSAVKDGRKLRGSIRGRLTHGQVTDVRICLDGRARPLASDEREESRVTESAAPYRAVVVERHGDDCVPGVMRRPLNRVSTAGGAEPCRRRAPTNQVTTGSATTKTPPARASDFDVDIERALA